ncbi:hypothetical protein B0H17DRAFT_306069 [Mycena rosella]|uniref:Uncharacterized protein n=1 Tax=Mycena rosella TaxID=1033263 RepID=A0AAD7GQ53_MYCRO|nr:hypothetical protein B0H17DRAFT_306069 [Mycena rosella]
MQPFPREEPSDVFWDEDRSDFDGEVDEDSTRPWTLYARCTRTISRPETAAGARPRLVRRPAAHPTGRAANTTLRPAPRRRPPDLECSCKKGYWSMPDDDPTSQEESAPGFSAAFIRRLSRPERSRLLRTLLDAALPGDVPLQTLTLQKHAACVHDLVGRLAPPLAPRVLRPLPVPHLLTRARALALPLPAPHARRPAPARDARGLASAVPRAVRATCATGSRRRCASSRRRTRRSRRRYCCAGGGSSAGRTTRRFGSGTSRRASCCAASRSTSLSAVWITLRVRVRFPRRSSFPLEADCAQRYSWWGSTTSGARSPLYLRINANPARNPKHALSESDRDHDDGAPRGPQVERRVRPPAHSPHRRPPTLSTIQASACSGGCKSGTSSSTSWTSFTRIPPGAAAATHHPRAESLLDVPRRGPYSNCLCETVLS